MPAGLVPPGSPAPPRAGGWGARSISAAEWLPAPPGSPGQPCPPPRGWEGVNFSDKGRHLPSTNDACLGMGGPDKSPGLTDEQRQWLSRSSGGWKSKMRVRFGEGFLPGCRLHTSILISHGTQVPSLWTRPPSSHPIPPL